MRKLAEKLIDLSAREGPAKVAKAWRDYSAKKHLSGLSPALSRALAVSAKARAQKFSVKISSRNEKTFDWLKKQNLIKDFADGEAEFSGDKELVGATIETDGKMIDLSLSNQIANLHKKLKG